MSGDPAFALLLPLIAAQRAPALWVLDEHGVGTEALAPNASVAVLSNRVDVAQAMGAAGWDAHFSDFDFSPWPEQGLDAVFLRLAKEKPVVHHVVNAAAGRLAPGGRLLLTGGKQQGIKSYAQHAARCLGGELLYKKTGAAYLAVITRGPAPAAPLDDKVYPLLRPAVREDELLFFSKPGLYGWDKVDEGSALLVRHLAALAGERTPRSVCDLGCGYGYLSVHAQRLFAPQRIVASDNNAAAVAACARNLAAQGAAAEVRAADCGEGIDERFDLVLCNPPFHQGFGVERDLTARFVAAARRLTAGDGMALFVTNAFIPIERIARAHFRTVTTVAENGRFKLVRMVP